MAVCTRPTANKRADELTLIAAVHVHASRAKGAIKGYKFSAPLRLCKYKVTYKYKTMQPSLLSHSTVGYVCSVK